MLSAAAFDSLSVPIVDLYEQYSQSVLNDISRRLAKMDMTSTAAWQMQRLSESGMVYQNALKELSRMTGKSEATLQALFEKGGVKSVAFDDRIYKAAGLNPLPLNLSPSMLNVLLAGLRKTDGKIKNLTMTTALSARNVFIDAADLAYMKVTTGAFSYNEAIRQAVKGMAAKGLSTIDYASGRQEALDVAMRRTVLTGVGQTTARLSLDRAGEMNSDLVQMSAHAGARPEHEVWQGKIFSLSGTHPDYPPFVESTGYGTVTGFAGINCRHTCYPFFEGLSENAYSKSDVMEMNNATVEYNGKQIGQYEASQIQRYLERGIRNWKRQADCLDSMGEDNSVESVLVKKWQEKMRDFIKETDLLRQRNREQI